MLRVLIRVAAAVVGALLCFSCSGKKEFRVDFACDDIGTQNVIVIYNDGDSYRSELIPAVDGNFTVTGQLSRPAFMEIFSAVGNPLGVMIVEGGDNIRARLSVNNPENISADGNDDAEDLLEFLAENREIINAKDFASLNHNIEDFVRDNPRSFVSTVLLTRYYTVEGAEQTASELITLLPDKYREGYTEGFEELLNMALGSDTLAIRDVRGFSRGDTARVFNPDSSRINLLILDDNNSRDADSIRQLIAILTAGTADRRSLGVTEFGCDRDTLLWGSSVRALPADYPKGVDRLWLVEGMAAQGIAQAAPTKLPYFILTDSAGRVVCRTPSVSAVRAAYGSLRRK